MKRGCVDGIGVRASTFNYAARYVGLVALFALLLGLGLKAAGEYFGFFVPADIYLVVAVVVFSLMAGKTSCFLPFWLGSLLLAFAIAATIATHFSPFSTFSFPFLSQWYFYIGLMIAVPPLVQKFDKPAFYMAGTVIVGLVLYAIYFVNYISQFDVLSVRNMPLVGNVRALGVGWGVGAALSIILLLSSARMSGTFVWIFFSVVFLTGVFWTGSRTPVLAGVIAFLIVCILRPSLINLRSFFLVLGVVAASACLALLLDPGHQQFGFLRIFASSSSLLEGEVNHASSNRLTVWGGYLDYLFDNWLVGAGEAGLPSVLGKTSFKHPENLFLYAWASWGIFGGLFFCILVFWVVVASGHELYADRESRELLIIGVLVFYIFLAALIEAGFVRVLDRIWFFSFAGLLLLRRYSCFTDVRKYELLPSRLLFFVLGPLAFYWVLYAD